MLGIIGLLVGCAYADQTSGATYTSPNGEVCDHFIEYLNEQEYIDHTHAIDLERDPELGVGLDVVVWQSKAENPVVEEVVVEGKYDIQNEESSAYVVARVNLFELLSKKE
jgi:hypothetical protein